jgi:hypothetical protein
VGVTIHGFRRGVEENAMSREWVNSDSVVYLISPDNPSPAGLRSSMLAGVRVLDELTGQPADGPITVIPDQAHCSARVAEGGLVGLSGFPKRAFPSLASTGYSAGFVVQAVGFVPRAVSISLPANPMFPATFSPPPVNDLALHRVPTVVRGRVVQAVMGKSVPVVAASITVTGIWRTPPPAHLHIPPDAPNVLSLAPPLYFDRATGAGQLSIVSLTPVLGDDKITLDAVAVGANPVRLSNSQNLLAGDIILLDPDDPERAEYLPIQSIAAGSTADQPASLTFTYATSLRHPAGTVTRKVTLGPAGAPKVFAQDGWVGDACVFLGDLLGLSATQQVRISGGAPDEYHAAGMFVAHSDAEGFYRLPPLSRVARLEAIASKGALKSDAIHFQPDYTLRENVLDFPVS